MSLSNHLDKDKVVAFFDERADGWDAEMIRSDAKIGRILDNAQVQEGSRVLDVATGTGVLVPDYLQRQVSSVVAIDISSKMIAVAREKFSGEDKVQLVVGDIETTDVGSDFDAIVIYNAFPHFPNPEKLIARLSGLLKKGGVLSVAHGMSRAQIDSHHAGPAKEVSMGLMAAEELAKLFQKHLTVTCVIDEDTMYQVCGKKE